jgi:hypothetical protein
MSSVVERDRRRPNSGVGRRGRRSLSGSGDSPQIRVRVPTHLRDLAQARANRERTTVSEVAREALEHALRPRRPEERVQLELHRALLGKLIADYDEARTIVRRNLARSRSMVRGDLERGWVDEWSELLEGPPERMVDVFLGEDEHSIDLRQVSPFAGVLSEQERLAAIGRAGVDAAR